MSNEPLSEQYRLVAKAWVDADAAANMLEELKSATLSQKMVEMMASAGEMPVSKAEMAVRGSEDWRQYIESMVEARKRANLLKVKLEYCRMRFSEWQSAEATKRAEMKL
jgi:hypothetical protein